jgi:hypothetical protein
MSNNVQVRHHGTHTEEEGASCQKLKSAPYSLFICAILFSSVSSMLALN